MKITETQTKTVLTTTIEKTPIAVPKTNANRKKIIEILKKNALAEWGNDSKMVNYEVKN